MLWRLTNIKALPRPLTRVLHVPSARLASQSFTPEDMLNDEEQKSQTTIQREVPYIMAARNYKYREGKVYHGFQCERIEYNPDFELTSCTFRHVDTGTEFWHLDRNDTNNVFSINFRTPPFDSTGVAHILEHLTLCGSKNFPVRDPFFKMLNRSVATNMNALTAADLTVYPFASRNEVDFRNIQRIYLDAVFTPNLLYLDFLQEGWRLEHKDLHDRKSELMIKGVVLTEMKGIFSENSRIFRNNIFNNILPNGTYKYIAGGDPLVIPKLTHSDLVEFHRKYYHPSNARMFCYGSFDIMETLALADRHYLFKKEFKDNSYSRVLPHPRWTQPREIHAPCRLSNLGAPREKQNQIGIALVMCDRTEIQETFELNVLTELLIRGPNSAFYKGLVEPGFSGGYTKTTGYYFNSRDTYFVVGLLDLKVEDFETFKELFDQTVLKTIEEGFDPQHLEMVLHGIELPIKHQRSDYGNELLFKSMALWNHDGDVAANLRVSEMIAKLRSNLKENKNYFQEKMEKYFVNNPHKLTLTMSPDESYDENIKQAERELLTQKVNYLSPANLEEVYQNGLKLEAAQKAKENIDFLPCLTLSDVKEPLKYPEIKETTVRSVPTQLCKLSTNSITYLKCLFNITGLSPEEIMLMPLFCKVVSNMGTSNHSFREFDQMTYSKTAGFDFKVKVVENVKDAESYRLGLMLSTHALEKNVPDMFELCEELLLNFKLDDTARLEMLIENYISNLSVGIANSGHLYAILSAAALVSNAAQLKVLLTGVDHIDFMKKYVETHSTEEIQDTLETIGVKVFSKSNMRTAINSPGAYQSKAMEHYKNFLDNLPILGKMKSNTELEFLKPSCQHYIMNTHLNYCAKSFFAVPFLHEDHPILRVLAKFVSAKYLLPVVREQNGAYGAGARISYDGLFNFYSYRDPHSEKTLDVFDKTYEWLQTQRDQLNAQTLFEAKLGVLQMVDWPITPGEVGLDYFALGVSQRMYEIYRARVLSVTADELRYIIEKYFKKEPKHVGKCILGPEQEKLKQEVNQKVVIKA